MVAPRHHRRDGYAGSALTDHVADDVLEFVDLVEHDDELAQLLRDLLDPPAWRARAACRGAEVNFFPTRGEDMGPAREVCAGCPVREECLADALERGDRHGVWGGTSDRERRALRRSATPATEAPPERLCPACGAVVAGSGRSCSRACANRLRTGERRTWAA